MGLNRKTNIWGLIGLILSMGKTVVDVHNGHPLDLTTILAMLASGSLGVGLTQAKDDNVTGVGAQAVKVHSDGKIEKENTPPQYPPQRGE